jgi:hypothetical protein
MVGSVKSLVFRSLVSQTPVMITLSNRHTLLANMMQQGGLLRPSCWVLPNLLDKGIYAQVVFVGVFLVIRRLFGSITNSVWDYLGLSLVGSARVPFGCRPQLVNW